MSSIRQLNLNDTNGPNVKPILGFFLENYCSYQHACCVYYWKEPFLALSTRGLKRTKAKKNKIKRIIISLSWKTWHINAKLFKKKIHYTFSGELLFFRIGNSISYNLFISHLEIHVTNVYVLLESTYISLSESQPSYFYYILI